MIPRYLALSSPGASFARGDAPGSSTESHALSPSLERQTRIINYRGQADERSMRMSSLGPLPSRARSFSLSPPPSGKNSFPRNERGRSRAGGARNNCENVRGRRRCAREREIDPGAEECGFRSGKSPKAMRSKEEKRARPRNDSIKKCRTPVTACEKTAGGGYCVIDIEL